MRKIYLLVLACIVLTGVNAQNRNSPPPIGRKVNTNFVRRSLTNGVQAGGGGCDTLSLDLLNDEPYLYYVPSDVGTGFFTGTSSLETLGNAQYFDESATTDNYIIKVFVFFGAAGTKDGTKVVPVNVYDGTNGALGSLLGTTNVTMQTIINDVYPNQYFTEIDFNPAIALPASKQFFVAVDYSKLTFDAPTYDSLAIVSTDLNVGTGAWENDNSKGGPLSGWNTYLSDWGFDLGLYIFPLLSPGAVCGDLPVHLTSFTAQAKGADVLVNWHVTQELNMSAYGVERAGSNLQFVSAGTVVATNAQLDHAYSFTDAGAASTAGGLFYRLKQVNKDGSFTYSNIIKVITNSNTLTVNFANPVSNVVQLHINSPVAQKLQAGIYDLLGRKVSAINDQVLTTGDNFVTMPTGALPKGVYILNLSAGGTAYKYKIVTQ